jgi:hypothetical protein
MHKYRKKPVEIEALQWTGDNLEDIFKFCDQAYFNSGQLKIETLEGTMTASIGDYIIKGVQAEFYPCKPDIFELTYDKVTN